MQRTCTQSAPINERCKSSLPLGITSVGSRCGLWEVKVEMCSYEDNCWEKVKSEIKNLGKVVLNYYNSGYSDVAGVDYGTVEGLP